MGNNADIAAFRKRGSFVFAKAVPPPDIGKLSIAFKNPFPALAAEVKFKTVAHLLNRLDEESHSSFGVECSRVEDSFRASLQRIGRDTGKAGRGVWNNLEFIFKRIPKKFLFVFGH